MGHFACGYCYHPGSLIKCDSDKKSVIRYVQSQKSNGVRSHADFIDIYNRLHSTAIKGIKKVSCMIAAPHFNLVNSFSIDSMHCVHLGVMKKLLNLWLDSKNHSKPFYITKKHQIALSQRIVMLKPVSEIIRRPR